MEAMHPFRRAAPIVGLALLLGGCGTMQLPPRLTPDERTLVESHRFDAVVGVAPYKFDHIRKDVRAVVSDTRLFTRVDFVEDLEAMGVAPDLVVSVQGVSGGTALIPILTLVSLGVLPTFARETMGYDLIFAAPDRSEALTVGYSFRGRVGLGILASPLNLLPGWDHPKNRPPERLGRRFAVEIAGRAEEIEALLAEPAEPSAPPE
jgi:hypothetical protein